MKQKGFFLGLVLLFFLLAMPAMSGYKVVNEQKDFYYGHISYSEIKNDGKDPVVFREGPVRPEVAILNLPLGPGDSIKTSDIRRCEVQFDNGTIVRLDFNTDLKIETILAQSLSTAKKLSNLLLAKGQVYVMSKKYNSLEIFQVITPCAAIKLDHDAVALISLTEEGNVDVQVEFGKVNLLYGLDKFHIYQTKVKQKERFIVSGDNQARPAEYVLISDFKSWNQSLNENFRALHEESFLPKPIRMLPQAVFNFAQRFGNIYGEWLWHDLYGYVWRPYYNDYYPWGNWSPYVYGNWTRYQSQLFWIPGEPWGWIPYHLGIWMWDKNKGWLWLPGSVFAPSWAVWDSHFGYYFWRPWTLFDWYYGPDYLWGYSYEGYLYYTYLSGQGQPPEVPAKNTLFSIRKDQLKKKDQPSLPLPKEITAAYKRTLAALRSGDERVLASLESIPRQTAIIKKGDLVSPKMQEKIMTFEQFSKHRQSLSASERAISFEMPQDASREALSSIQRSQIISDIVFRSVPASKKQSVSSPAAPLQDNHFVPGKINPPSQIEAPKGLAKVEKSFIPGPAPQTAQPSFRFRDWNPDIRTALKLGVDISYSSRTNEIRCPQLGLSSLDRNLSRGTKLTEHGLSHVSGSGATSDGSSGNSSAPAGSETRSSGASQAKESSGGGGEGKVKN